MINYPTPNQFYELIKSLRSPKDMAVRSTEFLNNIPRKDKIDECIYYIFSLLLLQEQKGLIFMRMGLEPDEPCVAHIDSSKYSIKIKNEVVRRLRDSGWNQHFPAAEVTHPIRYSKKLKRIIESKKEKKIMVRLEAEPIENLIEVKKQGLESIVENSQ
jgi:hypothetical protein